MSARTGRELWAWIVGRPSQQPSSTSISVGSGHTRLIAKYRTALLATTHPSCAVPVLSLLCCACRARLTCSPFLVLRGRAASSRQRHRPSAGTLSNAQHPGPFLPPSFTPPTSTLEVPSLGHSQKSRVAAGQTTSAFSAPYFCPSHSAFRPEPLESSTLTTTTLSSGTAPPLVSPSYHSVSLEPRSTALPTRL